MLLLCAGSEIVSNLHNFRMINLELIKTAQLYRKHCAGLSAIGELFCSAIQAKEGNNSEKYVY